VSRDLSSLPEDRVLMMMALHLKARAAHPVGSPLWAEAITGYAECKRELDRRLLDHIVKAVAERDAGEPLG
jgi:hypothetical protein